MGTETKDYSLKCEPARAVLSGQFSLSNPMEFENIFAEIQQGIEEAGDSYTIDVVGTHFMSSSGITALARVVMHARKNGKKLVLVVDEGMLWQRKTVVALQNLWEKLEIRKQQG